MPTIKKDTKEGERLGLHQHLLELMRIYFLQWSCTWPGKDMILVKCLLEPMGSERNSLSSHSCGKGQLLHT